MQSTKGRRRMTPTTDGSGDNLLVSLAIRNGEDVSPFVRKAFSIGKLDSLLHHLKAFTRAKETEIEEVCKAHCQEFTVAVDELRSFLSDVDDLKYSLYISNAHLQSVAQPLLTSLDAYIETHTVNNNVLLCLNSVKMCAQIVELCVRANTHLKNDDLYLALRCVEKIERDFLKVTPSSTLKKMLEKKIPEIRVYVEKKVNKEFGDWLVEIRTVSRNLGHYAIGQASSARQREEESRMKQRQAEDQSRLSIRDCVYALQEEDDGLLDVADVENSENLGFDLTPLYRAFHIHQSLGIEDQFKQYYFKTRKLQLISDFQVSSLTSFLESHQTFFAQISGFFIVEDRVLRTGGGLISKWQVENLWEMAISKMCSVLEDQFSVMQTANHLLLIKDYVSLLGVSLRRFGYPVDALIAVLSKHKNKYHDLLISNCSKKITDALAADTFEPMLMKKEYEYSMNVMAFQLQTSDITPAFPYVAPFSTTVPDCCRIVRSFIEDSVSYMSFCGQLDFYDVVKKSLDRLLSQVLDEALVKLIRTSVFGVSQAMRVAANMAMFERACEFFFKHASQLSGIPLRMADRGKCQFPLRNARDAAEEILSGMIKAKIDSFMSLIENVNWMDDEPPLGGNEYANEIIIFLETLVSTAQQILPPQTLKRVLQEVLYHISKKIVNALVGDMVKKLNENAIMGLDIDVQLLESFSESQSSIFSDADANQLKSGLAESRQLINLLLSNNPEDFINPVIREKIYNALDYKTVVIVSEKLRDPSDRSFFASRGPKPNPKKMSLDSFIKRLKEVS